MLYEVITISRGGKGRRMALEGSKNSMGVARSRGAGRLPCAILMLLLTGMPACAGGNGAPPPDSADTPNAPVGTPLPTLDSYNFV